MIDAKRIGIFDSGVGGLAVWEHISKVIPHTNTVYVADQKYIPYGEKSHRTIEERSLIMAESLINMNCDMIVIACNTATAEAADKLREKYKIPIIGLEPAIKPAIQLSRKKEITVLSTTATAKSKRQQRLLMKYARNTKVHLLIAPEFVTLVEIGEVESRTSFKAVEDFFHDNDIGKSDVLVLACTHFQFLKDVFKKTFGKKMKIIEPSKAVAKRVKSFTNSSPDSKTNKVENLFFTTGDKKKFEKTSKKLLKKKINAQVIKI